MLLLSHGLLSPQKYPQGLPDLPPAKDAFQAAKNGYEFYRHLQSHDGHWPGEYGGPMFLLPGLVIGSYISGMSFKEEERLEMIRYLFNRAHPEDGGWGMCVCYCDQESSQPLNPHVDMLKAPQHVLELD